MAAPATDWSLIRITGHLRDWSANELTGTCTFTPNIEHAESDATNMFVVGSTLTATFVAGILKDAALNSYIDIPATDDPQIEPTSWSYRVTITTPLKTISWDCSIPIAAPGGTLDLTDLNPVVPVAAVTPYVLQSAFGAVSEEVDRLADAVFNVRDFYLTADGTDWGLASQRAIDALATAPNGGTVYYPASDDDYTFETTPELRIGVNIKGAGRYASRILSTAGGFKWNTYLYGFNISDIGITTSSGGHMFTSMVAASTLLHSTFARCKFVQNDDTKSIFFQDGACTYIDNEVENCELIRASTSTVPAWYIRSSAGALNANTWRRLWCHSNNCSSSPFFHLESNGTTSWMFAYDNRLEDVIFEQSVGGCVRALSHRNLVIDNCREWDASSTYTASNFHIGKSPVGGGLNSAYCTLRNIGCGDQTLGGGTYHINIVPGEATSCQVILPNRAVAGQTLNLATDTILINEGKITAPLGFITGTATKWSAGAGSPDGAVTGNVGDLFSRTDGLLWSKASGTGNTGWLRVTPSTETTLLDAGETSIPRRAVAAQTAAQGSGTFSFGYFRALRTETINNVAMICAGTAAATVTLIRYGIYLVNESTGGLTLVASTANDTALFAATNTRYSKALSAAWSKTAGLLYAVGHLAVATTVPVVFGDNAQGTTVVSTLRATAPAISGCVPSQTDLLSTYAFGSITSSRSNGYMEFLP